LALKRGRTRFRIRPQGTREIPLAATRLDAPATEVVNVVGPICESGDYLAKNRKLPGVDQGELIAVMSAGAYGFSMSSNYNSRPRIAEVLVKDGKFHVVRKREEYADLTRGERVPAFLK